ncbi:MAG: bifunctional diaminohydroxyphosphoribosylaminopyrimidine deaminase/5-amino-6-(5-phosphoribosylamino)uracil reductase RibD [Microbacterium sp.]|uniref:bifunctional diaminohydroxyphosphoribosylaminopyrimidine deaminase/5-amino-6-(5-phosphoribosylamino)uracil reductase RibD n=1 Tax=Microbacterium sp. TaxID=51671 RepID=UPI00271B1FF4|nr:bifunctional diaminohydroxyphosphoribosylaminopyrimidine deaminase/5-amino-6-(5-phosphoribosylamino)uracil reductase RibD [Microbacterium sp.]MDO8382734.1 bifunctional diaminohydroxyphosphoribosylaminopyrimidine deaminase/5-amino-6-(5-phosphoribosylamino)uracil reductase RibD [Microbacterium sp.]
MTYSEIEWRAMGRAKELALLGPRGINPQVGAVVLSPTGEVLSEGWHRGAGNPHAEIEALSHLSPADAHGATMVVTLEPCNHTGRTGPCAVALLEAGVSRVVYAVADPAERSSGGAERLRSHGVNVESGVRADEVTEMLDSWLTVVRLGRPFVTVKWAQSLDGRAAANDGTSKWITGPDARADVHRRRAAADAIVVGTGTVLADDPALTARLADGRLAESQPLPVVIGNRPVPRDAVLRKHPRGVLEARTQNLHQVLDDLRERGVQSVFVEGGPTLASAFVSAGLADRVLTYVAPVLLGGEKTAIGDIGVSTMAEARRLTLTGIERLGDDLLLITEPARISSDERTD